MIRKKNDQNMGEVIQDFLNRHNLIDGINEKKIIEMYHKLMGPTITNRTEDIHFRRGQLILRIKSAPLKQELAYSKDKIKNIINKALEQELINEVILQ